MSSAETRFARLVDADDERSAHLLELAQADVDASWRMYEELAGAGRTSAPLPLVGAGRQDLPDA